ncbi:MAG TPA: glycosyltransferase family 39 protein [Micropepsaceae bacterium]|nr:glycosyltransferase family 39 protein [Micropepsaceae bacterium]
MTEPFPAFVRKHPLAVLLAVCVLAWMPGFFTLPPLDRDESRFAQATKQMLETRDFVDINLGGVPRYEKPVGIYWLQAASTGLLGEGARDSIWTYRVPSLLGALAAVAATLWLARAFAGVETAFFAGLILGLSVLLMAEAKIAKTDAVLLGSVTVAQAVILRTYLAARAPGTYAPLGIGTLLLGWAAFGLGVLVKGPVIALVCIASIAAIALWDRDWRWLGRLKPLTGLAVALAIVLPWAIAIGIASHGLFYQKSLGQDFASKLMGDAESHGAPPGYYTALVSFTFWPGSLLLLPGIVYGIARRREPAVRYLLAWAATTWLMFEFAPTKLPHYVLPAFPALAMLSALWLTAGATAQVKGARIAQYISLALFVLVGLVLAGFVAFAPTRFGSGAPWWLYGAVALGVAAVLAVIPRILARRFTAGAFTACLAAILLYGVAGFLTVPRLTDLWLSPRLAEAVARHRAINDPPAVTAGYAEPSIAFLLGTETSLSDGSDAGHRTASAGGLALVSDDQRQPFLDAVATGGAHAKALEEIAGLNYSRGRKTKITLYRVMPGAK